MNACALPPPGPNPPVPPAPVVYDGPLTTVLVVDNPTPPVQAALQSNVALRKAIEDSKGDWHAYAMGDDDMTRHGLTALVTDRTKLPEVFWFKGPKLDKTLTTENATSDSILATLKKVRGK